MQINIEINGRMEHIGDIIGNAPSDARFQYAESWQKKPENHSISISLPLQKEPFSPEKTKNFFDGLLPEGFTRRSVANAIHADENNYLEILQDLGKECLGAIQIGNTDDTPSYKKLSLTEMSALAREGVRESADLVTKAHLSLTGASGKAGLYYDPNADSWYLPLGTAPSTHIVKQSHIRLHKIITNEQLCLTTAEKLGIQIPQSFIINTGKGNDEDILFATKRYDRILPSGRFIDGLPCPCRLHQEDFAQALGIPSSEKYEKEPGQNYAGRLFQIIRDYTDHPLDEQKKLLDIIIFNYLIGNNDGHIKNISLLYSSDMKTIHLAPAYDIISTSIYENASDEMAFSIGGAYHLHDIDRAAFGRMCESAGIYPRAGLNQFDKMVSHFKEALYSSAAELSLQDYSDAETIADEIMHKGGVSYLNI